MNKIQSESLSIVLASMMLMSLSIPHALANLNISRRGRSGSVTQSQD